MSIRKTAFILTILLALTFVTANAKTLEFTVGSETIYVQDGAVEAKTLDAKPYIENSRTMIPVRAVCENLGAEVSWDSAAEKVTITSAENVIELFINSDIAKVNGEEKKLDTPPVIVDSRTMVPLRFVSEALGKNVEYVDITKQILISDEKYATKVGTVIITPDDYRALATIGGFKINSDNVYQFITSYKGNLTAIAILRNEANAHGFTLTSEQTAGIIDTVKVSADELYAESLVAPIVKFLATNEICYNYETFMIDKIYNDDFACAKHILILTQNMNTGEAYTEEQLKNARNTIDDIKKRLDNGEDFDKLMEEYCEDPGIKSYPDGYVFTYGEMVAPFEKTTFELKPGEISNVVETSYGYHIIKREELPEIGEQDFYKIENTFISELFEEYSTIGIVEENMTVNELAEILVGTNSDKNQ